MSQTPETDAMSRRLPLDNYSAVIQATEHARKLEQERDETRNRVIQEAQRGGQYRALLYGCSVHGLWEGLSCIGCLEQENTQLRAVCDELAGAFMAYHEDNTEDSYLYGLVLNAVGRYSSLPHVKARQ